MKPVVYPNAIRAIRKQRKLTLNELAERLDTTPATIRRFETGERNVSLMWLRRIADALNVSTDKLLGAEDGRSSLRDHILREGLLWLFDNGAIFDTRGPLSTISTLLKMRRFEAAAQECEKAELTDRAGIRAVFSIYMRGASLDQETGASVESESAKIS